MDILEQKRRVIATAIIAVVLTGIVIAAIVATPLINQLHSQASRSAEPPCPRFHVERLI